MKKLFLLLLPVLVLSGCSLNSQQQEPIEIEDEIIINQFDVSQIELIVDNTAFESYYLYKNIKSYGSWYIWVQIWWNDGITSNLVYIENDTIIKKSNDIFWYNFYVDHKIHEFCWNWETNTCPVAKETSCTIDSGKNEACVYSFFEYMFDLIQGNETNTYFWEKLEAFENTL